MEKCVASFLCAAACPSNCIYIEAAENTADRTGELQHVHADLSQRADAGPIDGRGRECGPAVGFSERI
jgi:Fe-S-cluster-containing hydrogenase component 2